MAEQEGLKACPFCGGEAELRIHPTIEDSAVANCKACACMFLGYRTTAGAIWEWNRRAGEQHLKPADAALLFTDGPLRNAAEAMKQLLLGNDAASQRCVVAARLVHCVCCV